MQIPNILNPFPVFVLYYFQEIKDILCNLTQYTYIGIPTLLKLSVVINYQ